MPQGSRAAKNLIYGKTKKKVSKPYSTKVKKEGMESHKMKGKC